jgi:hypothetical protein
MLRIIKHAALHASDLRSLHGLLHIQGFSMLSLLATINIYIYSDLWSFENILRLSTDNALKTQMRAGLVKGDPT